MKNLVLIGSLLITLCLTAQDGMRNLGMLRVHDTGGLGFHSNLLNDGILDNNLGLVGFYGNNPLAVSGAFVPIFHDMELLVPNGLHLNISISIENNTNFILGDATTPRTDGFVALTFEQTAFHTGAGDVSKVNGFVRMQGQQNFIFPVGDSEQLRPLILNSESDNPTTSCAYFFEDPGNFSTNTSEVGLLHISTREFWRLEGTIPSVVQLSWNQRSLISLMTNNVAEVVVVGWRTSTQQWENLGENAVGDLSQGIVTSRSFIPSDYELLTFGTTTSPEIFVDLPNYLLTPNGDGINDFLYIEALAQSPNNHMRIYDRNGMLVFDKENYTNEFNGYATEGDVVINRSNGLPSGVYFYLVQFHDQGLEYQGFLYLARN